MSALTASTVPPAWSKVAELVPLGPVRPSVSPTVRPTPYWVKVPLPNCATNRQGARFGGVGGIDADRRTCDYRAVVRGRVGTGAPAPVDGFKPATVPILPK